MASWFDVISFVLVCANSFVTIVANFLIVMATFYFLPERHPVPLWVTQTVGVIGGVVYGIAVVTKAISTSVESTKENLKGKGYTISGSGVSVKTNKRFDRESYVDATQRGFVKAVGASSFGKSKIHSPDHSTSDSYSNSSTVAGSQLSSPPLVNRTSSMGTAGSAGSFGSDGEKKSRNPFKRRTSSKS